jgi:hypothetical protein
MTLFSFGFCKCPSEPAIYTRCVDRNQLVVGVYVDDLMITGSCQDNIRQFKAKMSKVFCMSDLCLLRYYLGIEVLQSSKGISLCQAAYAGKILERSGMANCNPCQAPMECRMKLSKESKEPIVDKTLYRSIMGSLRYLVNTRPDLSCAVGYVNRFLDEPHEDHLGAVKHILRYVAGTCNFGLWFEKGKKEQVVLVGFSDSTYAGDVDKRKSTLGIIFFLTNRRITWQSMKQKVLAQSSCEAEYIAAANATCQALWLNGVLAEVQGLEPGVPVLKVDNKSAIALISNPVLTGQSRHIKLNTILFWRVQFEGMASVEFVGTNDQLGDILTKPLGRVKF